MLYLCRGDRCLGNKMEDWINIHTHKPGQGINIVDPCLGKVALPTEGVVFYSMGLHPLFLDGTAKARLAEIEKAAAGGEIVAVGEAGLDRNSPVPMDVQMDFFRSQAEIAGYYGLPLIIHGVRAIPELITVYNLCRRPEKWIIHGFNNRREILQDLLRHGFYISAGRHVMNSESQVFNLLPEIPGDRLFIETDNSDFAIADVYRAVAARKKMEIGDLQQIVRSNFRKLFPV